MLNIKSNLKYDTYLFDLDGTLSDSGEGIINAVKYALKEINIDIPDSAVLKKFIGPPLWESFEKFIGLSKEQAEEAVRIYRIYYKDIGLFENCVYDGIPQMLDNLKKQGCRLAVATSKPEPFSVTILEHFGIAHYFDNITGSLLDGSRRNKKDVIACALDRLGNIDKSRTIMVGDRMHDIIGARENGLGCAAVLYGYGERSEFEEYGAAHIVETPIDITKL